MARKHFVIFFSPGTFVSEQSAREIAEWDTRGAARLAATIVERYGSRPYGFVFTTELHADPVPDGEGGTLKVAGKEVARSGMHFLCGKIETREEVEARNLPNEETLRWNMRVNGIARVVTGNSPYKWTHEYPPGSCIVDADGTVIDRASEGTV